MQAEELKKVVIFHVVIGDNLRNKKDQYSLNRLNDYFNRIKNRIKENPPPQGILALPVIQWDANQKIIVASTHYLGLDGFQEAVDVEGRPFHNPDGTENPEFGHFEPPYEHDWVGDTITFIREISKYYI